MRDGHRRVQPRPRSSATTTLDAGQQNGANLDRVAAWERHVSGRVGDADPVQAIADELATWRGVS
jgi:hypothetical protein